MARSTNRKCRVAVTQMTHVHFSSAALETPLYILLLVLTFISKPLRIHAPDSIFRMSSESWPPALKCVWSFQWLLRPV